MNKTIYIIHGWDGSPNEPMHVWIKKELEEKGFNVVVPDMPNPEKPEIKAWVNKLKDVVKTPSEDTYFIGHSIGCQGVLRYIETINRAIKIGGVILIAPWIHLDKTTMEEEGEEVAVIAKPWMDTPINWVKIKEHTSKFVCIFSDNDPYVPLDDKEIFEDNLDAKIIIEHNKGHFTETDDVAKVPFVIKELMEISRWKK